MKAKEIKQLERALNEYVIDQDLDKFKSMAGTLLRHNRTRFEVNDDGNIVFDDGKRRYTQFEIVSSYERKVEMKLRNTLSQLFALREKRVAVEILARITKEVIASRET